jgi:protein-disulfide isomerase
MIRRSIVLVATALLCLAQEPDWRKVDTLPGVDFSGLSKPQRDAVLAVLRSEPCACGCAMRVAECRVKDPSCGNSRRLAAFAVRAASAGKSEAAIRLELDKYAQEPPPVLEPPVRLSIAGAPFRGPADAKVTIVEFSDFQCPYCAMASVEAAELLQKFPRDVKLVFKQFPLDAHSQAELAAEASLAAHAQGRFWVLHDKMYANFRQIGRARILEWATQAGLDMNRFRTELDGHKYAARVHAEEQEGEIAGVEGTPTFFIDGKKFNGVFEVKTIAPIVADELRRSN